MRFTRHTTTSLFRHGTRLAWVVSLAVGASLGCGSTNDANEPAAIGNASSALEATNDDLAWVTRTLPVVLGRRARGAGELLALANATNQMGKQRVLDQLMDSDEFIERWSGFFLERLRAGRVPGAWNHAKCYETPLGADRSAWESAARVVRAHGEQAPVATSAGAGTFVMADVIRGGIAIDDAIPIYRAFPFALVQRTSSLEGDFPTEQRQLERGNVYTEAVLNRSATCMECHHTKFSSTSGTFLPPSGTPNPLLPAPYEALVFPVNNYVGGRYLKVRNWATGFSSGHLDVGPEAAGPATGNAPFPGWEISRCGELGAAEEAADLSPTTNAFIGGLGSKPTVWKVDAAFVDGYRSISWSDVPTDGPGMAMLMLAAAFTNDVWREVMGKSLTIPNFVSRTSDQYVKLRNLAAVAMVRGPVAGGDAGRRLSLRSVLSRVLTSREWTGSVHDAAGDVFEPFLPGPDVLADRVHRHSADVLFRSAAHALGKSPPTHFPRADTSPSLNVAAANGLALAPGRPESTSVSLDGMLAWEDKVAKCDTGAPDFMGALFRHAATRPGLRLRDLVEATKMRITGVPVSNVAEEGSLTTFFGTSLETPYDASQDARLRGLCSVLLRSPDFMLSGGPVPSLDGVETMAISTGDLDAAGNLVVEDELTACRTWRLDARGTYDCDPAARETSRRLWARISRICPRGRCAFLQDSPRRLIDPVCLSCPPWKDILTSAPPRDVDPRDTLALPPPAIPQSGGVFLVYAPKARLVALSSPTPYFDKSGKMSQLSVGQALEEGDSFVLEPGLKLRIESPDGGVFETDGLPPAPEKGRFSLMIGGPAALAPEIFPTVSTPMSQADLDASIAEKHAALANEPGSRTIVHTATSPFGNVSYLDDPATNGHPEAVLIVTKRGGATARRLGTWYDHGRGQWAVYDESRAALPVGFPVNVRVLAPSGSAYVHKAVAGSVSGHITYLDHPRLNGHPEASIQVTHQYAPPGSPGIYDDHPVGVWYDGSRQRWSIYHDDFAPMPIGCAFAVKLGSLVTVTASAENLVNGALRLDELQGVPVDSAVFLTHNFAPMGLGGAHYTKEVGVRFDTKSTSWLVENLDGSPIPSGVAFNVHRPH